MQAAITRPKLIATVLKTQYTQSFFNTVNSHEGATPNSGNKLRTYATFKLEYKIEEYLKIQLPQHITSAIAKLRTSTHKLAIETNRYTRPRIPPEQRICKYCTLNTKEDEIHFLFKCPLYTELRNTYINEIENISTFNNDPHKLIHVMTQGDREEILKLGIYICKANYKRTTSQVAL